jgi:hypothetical protein
MQATTEGKYLMSCKKEACVCCAIFTKARLTSRGSACAPCKLQDQRPHMRRLECAARACHQLLHHPIEPSCCWRSQLQAYVGVRRATALDKKTAAAVAIQYNFKGAAVCIRVNAFFALLLGSANVFNSVHSASVHTYTAFAEPLPPLHVRSRFPLRLRYQRACRREFIQAWRVRATT